jgi:hypothetical protein
MTPKNNAMDDSASIIEEIESNLEKVLQKRRGDIERELQEKIRKEKEESERKLSLISEAIAKERESLKDYRETINEYETRKNSVLAEIRGHLERGMGYQREIEKLTTLTLAELRSVDELSGQLTDIRQKAEEKIAEIRTMLKERYGLEANAAPVLPPAAVPSPEPAPAPAPKPSEENGLGADLEQELSRLKKIKELLEKDVTPESPAFGGAPLPEMKMASEPPAVPEEPALVGPSIYDAPAPPAEFKMPEINQFIQDFVRKENETSAPEPFPEPVRSRREDRKAPSDEINFQTVFEMLEKYRKSEPTDYNGEISYFQSKDRLILDGESLVRAVSYIQDTARKLVQKLAQTESPKDQFFLKQELINNQEVLRKVILRSVRMCEKENATLPRFSADVLSVAVLKEILEKLNMDNWSNQDDFRAFEEYVGRLKDMFYKRITPPAHYLQSIVDELEG